MTCDERLEALLNRAGQTISDVKPIMERRMQGICTPITVAQAMMDYYADIIDRMETALNNVIGERDYLRGRFHCFFCKHYEDIATTEPCKSCLLSNGDPGFELDEDKPIMPEDWRVDDELHLQPKEQREATPWND